MSEHDEQPFDNRHTADVTRADAPAAERLPMLGEHIGNDHQAPPGGFSWTPEQHNREIENEQELPRRRPGQLIHPHIQQYGYPPHLETQAPAQGLVWHTGDGTARHDLANFPWENNRHIGAETSNIELRTIYAHLIEAATLARAEMRERGMQVDL